MMVGIVECRGVAIVGRQCLAVMMNGLACEDDIVVVCRFMQ